MVPFVRVSFMGSDMSYFFESLQRRRLARRVEFLAKKNGQKLTSEQVDAVIDEALAEHATYEGPIADLFAKLIQDIIDNPEKWLKIIMTIISLFAESDG